MKKVKKTTKQEIFTVYMLRTSSNTLYTGQTNNIDRRMKQHTEKKSASAKYMRLFESFTLVHTEKFASRAEAMKREAEIKRLPKKKKELLITTHE